MNGNAVIITHCRSEKDYDTNLLTINSIRTGYPNARVLVIDNASLPPLQQAIKTRATELGFDFLAANHAFHEVTIRSVLQNFSSSTEPLIILDADVMFWEGCESWEITGLIAGRLIPKFRDEYSGTITHPRLHTSHVVIPRPDRLALAIQRLEATTLNLDVIRPVTVLTPNGRERYDTMSLLYLALGSQAQPFSEEQLNQFDHVFCGSSLDIVAPQLNEKDGDELREIHERARIDPTSVRGVWRWQDDFFRARSVDAASPSSRLN